MDTKRKAEDMTLVASNTPKKARTELVSASQSKDKALKLAGITRTSNLSAPIMQLEGHGGDIFTAKFHPEGHHLASSGFDRQIFYWNVYGECENIAVLSGHSGAVMELHFTPDGTQLVTASTDKTVALWDISQATRVKRFKGHSSFVNSCHAARRGPSMFVSGSDDGTVRVWDSRRKQQATTLNSGYQVIAVTFNDNATQAISSGIDNDIKVWDLRQNALLYKLKGHTDTVTGLSLSPDGSYVMSNGMDNVLRIWDIRPYAPQERCVKIFQGHQHNFEKNLLRCSWSADGSKIAAGSSDRFVYIWDTTTRRILYKLPGHNGSVNEIDFHPKEPIVLSASSDKTIFLGEIE
ncbi:U5 small nuclear ribonucleoprotein 40 kDa protein [Cloeon dipterum]|uniref:U5 small nuclear ribonucleoprotein 40 kDa protein n=1 Tax=Cloeon dipterum TaxID=197152 RepID=UPI00322021CD